MVLPVFRGSSGMVSSHQYNALAEVVRLLQQRVVQLERSLANRNSVEDLEYNLLLSISDVVFAKTPSADDDQVGDSAPSPLDGAPGEWSYNNTPFWEWLEEAATLPHATKFEWNPGAPVFVPGERVVAQARGGNP